jgi:hypothetical protein
MPKSPLTAAPPIAVVPDVPKSDYSSANASETELQATGAAFSGAGLKARFYKPIDRYEGKHRYDPDFVWEPEEERKVVRKVRNQAYHNIEHKVLTVNLD